MRLAKPFKGSNFSRTLAVLLIAIIVVVPVIFAAKKQVHNFDSKCSTCHMSIPPDKKRFVREIDFLCADCHAQSGPSHPSGIKPSMTIPPVFQLDWAGRMTCSTCHDTHGNGELLLRGNKPGKAFCFLCHQDLNTLHKVATASMHTRARGSMNKMNFEVTNPGSQLDKVSKECLGCHDGTLGSLAEVTFGAGVWNHGNGVSHPIGVNYMEAYGRGGLHHPSGINPAIKFFDGKIGCGSCHSIFAKDKFQLAVSIKGSALCFACHNK